MILAIAALAVALTITAVIVVVANRGTGRRSRTELLRDEAPMLGLSFTDEAFDAALLPFSALGEDIAVTNVLGGSVEGRPTWYFDATRPDAPDSPISCVLTRLDAPRPSTLIVGRDLRGRLGVAATGTDPVPLDSAIANVVEVTSVDAPFATDLLKGDLEQFLARFGADCVFEVHGNYLLCCTRLLAPARVARVLKAACSFLAAVPRDVWERSAA